MADTELITLRSLALADAFGVALTAFEVWRYAPAKVGLSDVLDKLEALERNGTLYERYGHYVFLGREELIETRLRRSHFIGAKRRRALRWTRWLVRLPYVRGVFAYGSLATGNTGEESDLDVYIVLDNGRIFIGRTLVSIFLETFGVRRTGTKIKNQICLNHFVIDSALTFPKPYRSPFSAWLWARMTPLAVSDETLPERFYEANKWVTEFFPNMRASSQLSVVSSQNGILDKKFRERRERVSRNFYQFPLDAVERWLGGMQLRKIANHPKTKEGKGRVVANERELIFHPSLPEEKVMRRFHERLDALGLK